jgi:hypothetical protein
MPSGYARGMEEDKLPEGIGPHEGRELELMLAGKKPLAMFNDDLPPDMEPSEIALDPYAKAGRFIKREIVINGFSKYPHNLRFYFYSLPGEAWRMDRLIEIERGFIEDKVRTTPELETEIGRLLGYDDPDIQVFVHRWFEPKGKGGSSSA